MSYKGSHITKEIKIIISLLVVGFLLFLFIKNFNEQKEYYKKGILMDTFVEIRVWGKDGDKAVSDCWEKLEHLADILDRFNKKSEIYKINSNSGKWVKVSKDTIDVIEKAIYYSRLTDGYFDPTIAPILELWGFYDKDYKVPEEAVLRKELKRVDYKKIQIKDSMVFVPKGMEIDLGGIAKGYILDRLLSLLGKYKIRGALLNIGGQIGVYGRPKEDNKWEIRIRDPRRLDDYIGSVYINEGSVATSGDYERYFVKNGVRYCHLINPKTGYPQEEIMSVSVISKKAVEADALSTAFFVMGDKAMSYWQKFADLGVIIVFKDRKIWYSPNIYFVKK
ncbi:FAD:protein FMN transferase [Dictyoglomus thermophilum]|uniref:FAD:protein FMN transferase n=1 Tax=Dictyoglomus thermophilum (strain ATCC 35947 / DSM 3960 / H-6-12) TaxID=309799 RepID=B5YE61_DICT6|nr:FAD:protein FMN transferase [Dictyoglomus thermophilum]ACI19120.1 thiamine biosynthesis lipoprotein ApbE [Dictyoglomus thermophilum H-6-12]